MGKVNLSAPHLSSLPRLEPIDKKIPLMILDINRAEFREPISTCREKRRKLRSKSEERPIFRLHVLFGQKDQVFDMQRKKDWVFDTDLNVSRSKYLDMVKMFKESVQGLERRPEFFTYYSMSFICFFSLLFNSLIFMIINFTGERLNVLKDFCSAQNFKLFEEKKALKGKRKRVGNKWSTKRTIQGEYRKLIQSKKEMELIHIQKKLDRKSRFRARRPDFHKLKTVYPNKHLLKPKRKTTFKVKIHKMEKKQKIPLSSRIDLCTRLRSKSVKVEPKSYQLQISKQKLTSVVSSCINNLSGKNLFWIPAINREFTKVIEDIRKLKFKE